jgi:hypothetical protein
MAAQGTGFWADAVTEPKRAYRWVMNFRGIDQWMMKKVAKPNFTISESEHSFLNYKFYFPGRVEWSEISCTLVDPIQPDASVTLMKLLQDAGYVYPSDIDQAAPITISKKKSIIAIGRSVIIKQIDADGEGVVEAWELKNPWIKSVNFGQLDYQTDDIVEIELTLRYDWAQLLTSKSKTRINFAPGTGRIGASAVGPPPKK